MTENDGELDHVRAVVVVLPSREVTGKRQLERQILDGERQREANDGKGDEPGSGEN